MHSTTSRQSKVESANGHFPPNLIFIDDEQEAWNSISKRQKRSLIRASTYHSALCKHSDKLGFIFKGALPLLMISRNLNLEWLLFNTKINPKGNPSTNWIPFAVDLIAKRAWSVSVLSFWMRRKIRTWTYTDNVFTRGWDFTFKSAHAFLFFCASIFELFFSIWKTDRENLQKIENMFLWKC